MYQILYLILLHQPYLNIFISSYASNSFFYFQIFILLYVKQQNFISFTFNKSELKYFIFIQRINSKFFYSNLSLQIQRKILRLQNDFRKQQYANEQADKEHTQLQSLSNALNNTKSQLQLNQKFQAIDQIDNLEYENQNETHEQIDEYTKAQSPKILITTSRNPSPKLKQFIKELAHIIPTAERINRGQRSVQELMQQVREAGFTDLIIAHENRGTPDALVISHVPFGPTLWLQVSDLVLKQDVNPQGTFATKAPHLIFENLNQKVGKRIIRILQHLFPEPKEDSDRVIAFMNRSDTIVFRNYQFAKVDKEVVLKEQGPRFNMMPFKIQSDSLDQKGDVEWQLNNFTNTAYKVQVL